MEKLTFSKELESAKSHLGIAWDDLVAVAPEDHEMLNTVASAYQLVRQRSEMNGSQVTEDWYDGPECPDCQGHGCETCGGTGSLEEA